MHANALLFVLYAASFVTGQVFGQPPAEEKRAGARRGGEAQEIPLDRLPTAGHGMIVVTPDLKKALDALGAGSVVLSAERYQELMNKVERPRGDKSLPEILFAKCLITGEVKIVNGREMAELQFELEFKTETAGAVIPLPFKGMRIRAASLNGEPPIWGPDPEKWSVIVPNPQVSRLKLSTSVAVTRSGTEKRLTLERVPASAITSLELVVPGVVPGAMVLGYGSVTTQPGGAGKTLLAAPALGVLSSLDLTWQTGEAPGTPTPATIEGDIRVQLEEAQALVEARFKPVPFLPIQLPWKVRLPRNSQQVKAELARGEGGSTESLVVTKQAEGVYQLNSPYAMNTASYSQVVLRWKQALPESESAEAVMLGSCEIVEPAGRDQTGNLQVQQPDDALALLKPKHLVSLERSFLAGDRESRRVQRYRYQQQPAGLEAVALPLSVVRGLIEAKVNHVLAAQEKGWLLTTEIEIVRSSRANLSVIELAWPGDWPVSRKLLFSPAVKEIEQDTAKERVRIILDGRQPESLTLRLESQVPSQTGDLSVQLPQLLSAQGKQQDRSTPIDVISQELFRIDASGWELQISPNMAGLAEEQLDGQRRDSRLFRVINRPASITVNRSPRLPKWSSTADVFVGKSMLKTHQSMELKWSGSGMRQVPLLVPRSVKNLQIRRMQTDGRSAEQLVKTAPNGDDGSPMKKWLVDIPTNPDKSLTLLCSFEQDATHPITVPLARIDETEASLVSPVTVKCVHEEAIKLTLARDLPGWKVERQDGDSIEISGQSIQPLLVLDRTEQKDSQQPLKIKQARIKLEADGLSWLVEMEANVLELRATEIQLQVQAGQRDIDLIGWKLNDRLMPVKVVQSGEVEGATVLRFPLPADLLLTSPAVSVALRLKREQAGMWITTPRVRWLTGGREDELTPVFWQVRSDPTQWLWWSNQRMDGRLHPQQGWLPVSPVSESGLVSDASFSFRATAQSASLRMLVIPRSLSLVVVSGLAFVVLRSLARQPAWRKRIGWFVLLVLLVLLVIAPVTAAALGWSAVPGVLLGVTVLILEHVRGVVRPRRTAVFQRSGADSTTILRPAYSVSRLQQPGEAATVISSPAQAQRS